MSPKIPVELRPTGKDGVEAWRGEVPLSALTHSSDNIKRRLDEFVGQYTALVTDCRTLLAAIEENKHQKRRVSPVHSWQLGDRLFSFLEMQENGDFFVNGFYAHLSRDLGVSGSSLEKFIRFRRRVPDPNQIDPQRDWSFYRDAPAAQVKASLKQVLRKKR